MDVPAILLLLTPVLGQICDVTHDPDVKYFDVRLEDLEVPDALTTYVCQQFKVPDDSVYHAVAFQPLINNHNVMHHMLLFGCPSDIGVQGPHRCSAVDQRCPSWLAQWTMGVKGQVCTHPGTGVRFGKGVFSHMALQIHWNNAQMVKNMSDSSGMRIYYTSKLRQHDVGNVQVGQNDLELPPGTSDIRQKGSCSGGCTKNLFPHSIYLTRTYIHMHYLGVGGVFEIYRNGRLISTVAVDHDYDYKVSPIHVHEQPFEVKPGDEMRLTCIFDTSTGDRKRTYPVYFGEGSSAEMCYAFVTYYPRVQDLDQCVQFAEYDVCGPTRGLAYGNCSFSEFMQASRTHLISDIVENCRNMTDIDECSSLCGHSLTSLRHHPCMQGRLGAYAKRTILPGLDKWKTVKPLYSSSRCTHLYRNKM